MVSAEDFRKRLDAVNRGPLPQPGEPGADLDEIRRRIRRLRREAPRRLGEPVVYRRDLPRAAGPVAAPPRTLSGPPVVLEEATSGTEAVAPHGGRAYVVVNRLEEAGEPWAALSLAFGRKLLTDGARLAQFACADREPRPMLPEEIVFLDLETTGLASTPLFLIGTMVWEGGSLVLRQYFARDYAEERAVISLFLAAAADKRLLVSFNGKSFDLPYIRMRAAANAVPFAVSLGHLDMVHACRRAWRRTLPDCKLQTLESYVCGRARHSDIHGSEIPDAYHAFVRTGNAAQIVQILEHNMMDLATLAELLIRIPRGA